MHGQAWQQKQNPSAAVRANARKVVSFGPVTGISAATRALCSELRAIAASATNLLLEGETGTGKEVVARAVHEGSAPHGAFFTFDCRRLEGNLVDELLRLLEASGPRRANARTPDGTLFLDEVTEMPAITQRQVAQALSRSSKWTRRRERLRVISATQADLATEAANGRFDVHLFHLLSQARVRLLPLRARREDIPALVAQLQRELGCLPPSSATLDLFQKYDWPGNVRELRNALVRSTVLRGIGGEAWLPQSKTMIEPVAWSDAASMPYHAAREQVVGDFERAYLVEVLRRVNFDLGLAAKRTGLSLPSLYRLLKKGGLRLKDLRKTNTSTSRPEGNP